jgi:hypothetical protein
MNGRVIKTYFKGESAATVSTFKKRFDEEHPGVD